MKQLFADTGKQTGRSCDLWVEVSTSSSWGGVAHQLPTHRRERWRPERQPGSCWVEQTDWNLGLLRQLEFVGQDSGNKKSHWCETEEIYVEVPLRLGQTLVCYGRGKTLKLSKVTSSSGEGVLWVEQWFQRLHGSRRHWRSGQEESAWCDPSFHVIHSESLCLVDEMIPALQKKPLFIYHDKAWASH